jgi:putative phage-type endonuclease
MTISGTLITPDNRDAWLEERRLVIGGSDAANVVGLGRDSPVDTWQEKLGLAPPRVVTDEMRWGSKLEPLIAREYCERNGVELVQQLYVVHPDVPYMAATLDGVRPDGGLVEIKTTGWSREWGDEDSDQVPPPYLIQTHHQMACTGASFAHVAVLIRGNRYRQFTVRRDDDLIATLLDRERTFWQCVERKTPPWWGKQDARTLAILNPECAGEVAIEDRGLLDDIEAIEDYNAGIREMASRRDELKVRILAAMGNNQIAHLPDGRRIKRFLYEVAERTQTVKGYKKHYFSILKGDEA